MSKGLDVYAVVLPGLEEIAACELLQLGARDAVCDTGGVTFRASPDAIMRVGLRARTVTRVLLRLSSFNARSINEMVRKARRIDWARYVQGRSWRLHVSTHRSRLWHSGRIADALNNLLSDFQGDGSGGAVDIFVRLDRDRCQLSLCASHLRMDRRGYRIEPGPAPMRESLASALLYWSGWQPGRRLWVPMCGSGTLAIEAAQIDLHASLDIQKPLPCVGWPGFSERRWRRVCERAKAMQRKKLGSEIAASDLREDMIVLARHNAERAGVEADISWVCCDFFSLTPDGHPGWLVLNPPYGRRMGEDIHVLYHRIGMQLKCLFSDWSVLVVTPDAGCERALGRAPSRRLRFRHGGRWVHALMFEPI
ncbi:MAG: RNA methyltransferase [Zetaproteobacteria bacterium]|nr:MAG: RNA methyltransferase [Zetaproteobacteria bacterium]